MPAHEAAALRSIILNFSQHAGSVCVHRLVKPAMVPYVAAWMLENRSAEASESWLRICTQWKKVYSATAGSALRSFVHRIMRTERDKVVHKWTNTSEKETMASAHTELVLGQRVEHTQRGCGSVCMVDHTLEKCYHVQYDSGEQHYYNRDQASPSFILHGLLCLNQIAACDAMCRRAQNSS